MMYHHIVHHDLLLYSRNIKSVQSPVYPTYTIKSYHIGHVIMSNQNMSYHEVSPDIQVSSESLTFYSTLKIYILSVTARLYHNAAPTACCSDLTGIRWEKEKR